MSHLLLFFIHLTSYLLKDVTRLVWCYIILTNQRWKYFISFISSRYLLIDCSIICSSIFQVLKLSWWGYTSPGHIVVLLLIVGTAFDLLLSLEIFSVLHKFLKIIINSSENHLATLEVLQVEFQRPLYLGYFEIIQIFLAVLTLPYIYCWLKVFVLGKREWSHPFSTSKMKTEIILQGLI